MPPFAPVPTIETIAMKVGVSVSTVSRALRGDRRISNATASRVRAAARELGYRPNPLISALMSHLRTTKTPEFQSTIAYLDTSSNPVETRKWSSGLLHYQAACERAFQLGYSIERFWFYQPEVSPQTLVRILRSRGIQGLIVHYLPTPGDELHALPMDVGSFAVASLGSKMNSPALHYACIDHYFVMQLALQNLQRLGYRRIGVAIDAYVENIVEGRFLGAYLRWERNIDPEDRIPPFVPQDFSIDSFARWYGETMPQAIVCISSDILTWLKELDIAVPETVGVVHLDLDRNEGQPERKMSGIRQRHDFAAASAVDLIVSQLHGNERGIPKNPTALLTGGEWVEGKMVRQIAPSALRPERGKLCRK